jgi:hypothetical protein
MRVFSITPIKNEASRYLESALTWLRPIVDEMVVIDDRSTDDSVEIALKFTDYVAVRSEGAPSFLEHEGRYRASLWGFFERELHPQVGDWVLACDADEFLVADRARQSDTSAEIGPHLHSTCRRAEASGCVGVVLPVPEVFLIQDGRPFVRTDGYWGTIAGPRLFAYMPHGSYPDKKMASGAEPTYVAAGPLLKDPSHGLRLLHFGYAHPDDRRSKYERYTGTPEGHSSTHVQSIVAQPILEQWMGPLPNVWRGGENGSS